MQCNYPPENKITLWYDVVKLDSSEKNPEYWLENGKTRETSYAVGVVENVEWDTYEFSSLNG